ncbi:universal stress protein [Albimonas pacifica]|uniref:Nucleotide-binding universal stress protein, UspA family n=1 Tax=Albimonas pacifica TaxID=1114924 RepID=A0A1I3P2V2_9RHOB|nr:universal stress protein [Albimonas pacifica]SFJ15386.1 Nucleotide-binding universal stress protein, UspA family [Albimonas pacifica]
MYSSIMTPVDLGHLERLRKSLDVAAGLARQYDAPITYVAVTSPEPGAVAHSPEEFAAKLERFARSEGESQGVKAAAKAMVSHDPRADLDKKLLKAVDEIGADLVVMQSHVPNLADYLWPSNGGSIAAHSRASVFVVR